MQSIISGITGIDARLHRVRNRTHDVAATLIEEAERLEVDLMVMGGHGHSRLREMLLGGVTYDLLHQASIPKAQFRWRNGENTAPLRISTQQPVLVD